MYDPNGAHIYFGQRSSSLGGSLQIDMASANSIEIITFNSYNSPSIVHGSFTCKVVFYSCRSTCGVPILYNVTILQGLNNSYHYYSGVATTASSSNELHVATFTVA